MSDPVAAVAAALGVTPPTAEEVTVILDLARDVAHTTERRNAPLVSFLVGLAVAGEQDRATALAEVAAQVRRAIGTTT